MVEPERKSWWSEVSRLVRVTTAPVLQVAADGRWETAEVVPLTDNLSAARPAIEHVAQVAAADLAVEILWPAQAFVGVRWSADSWEQAVAAVGRVTARLAPRGQTVEAGLLALLGTTPDMDLELVELGAVNAWRSTGPERLWQRGEVLTAHAADSVLARRPDLVNCSHPLAVEFAVTNPRPCWIGVYVSARSGPTHRLDQQLLTDVLDRGATGSTST